MSLTLAYSLPRGVAVNTFGEVFGLGGVHLWVPVAAGARAVTVQIAAADFIAMAEYVLTNTNLEKDDPRPAFLRAIGVAHWCARPPRRRDPGAGRLNAVRAHARRVVRCRWNGEARPCEVRWPRVVTDGVSVQLEFPAPAVDPTVGDLVLPTARFLEILKAFLAAEPFLPNDLRLPFLDFVRTLEPVLGHGDTGRRLAPSHTHPAR